MITDIFFYIISWFMVGLHALLSIITFVIPTNMITAISNYVGYLNYLQGILPIQADPSRTGLVASVGLINIFDVGMRFIVAWYSLKMVLFLLNAIPLFGKWIHIPRFEK